MPDPSGQHDPNAEHPSLRGTTVRTVISREKFESVPRKRALYIGLYVFSFILWAILAFVYLRLAADSAEPSAPADSVASDSADSPELSPAEETPPEAPELPPWARVARVLVAVCIAAFYVPFISVLRIMGYPWVAILAFCGFVLAPIPGLLIVAYMDTRIAKAWNLAELTIRDAAARG